MKILVLDGSEGSIYFNLIKKYIPENELIFQTNRDISFRSISHDFYDVIFSFGGNGRMYHEELVEQLRNNRTTHRPTVVCVERNPKTRALLDVGLKAFRHYVFDVDQTDIIEEVFKNISGKV